MGHPGFAINSLLELLSFIGHQPGMDLNSVKNRRRHVHCSLGRAGLVHKLIQCATKKTNGRLTDRLIILCKISRIVSRI